MKPDTITVVRGQLVRMLVLWLLLLSGGCVAVVLLSDAIVSMHWLSTKDAPRFSEAKFSYITNGMTPAQVRSILGEPLRISRIEENVQEWWYTSSKEPIDGWGTWDGRYLIISNDTVAEIFRHTILNH